MYQVPGSSAAPCETALLADAPGSAGERLVEVGGGITLCYETFGSPGGRPLLLVSGLGMQHISYADAFCEGLAGRGLLVVRFDNRDVGLSTRWPSPPPTIRQLITRRFPPRQYDLGDMACDAAGLLRALDLAPAHVVGVSMGGMIGQTLAARHPELVRSLVSILASTGGGRVGQPAPTTLRRLLARPAPGRDAAIERAVAMFRHIGSHGFPLDEATLRLEATRAYDRAYDPAGAGRQLAAVLKSGDRTSELARIRAPTLVIHGDRDRMVHPSGGRATAAAIPGARLETIAGMGHDLPTGAWPILIDLIAAHVDAAQPPT